MYRFLSVLRPQSLEDDLENLDICSVNGVTTEKVLVSLSHGPIPGGQRIVVAQVKIDHAVVLKTHVTPNDDLARFVVIDGCFPVVLGRELDTPGKGENEGLGVSLVACGTCLEGTSCVATEYVTSGALVDSKNVGLPVHPLFGKVGIAAVIALAVEQVHRELLVTEP